MQQHVNVTAQFLPSVRISGDRLMRVEKPGCTFQDSPMRCRRVLIHSGRDGACFLLDCVNGKFNREISRMTFRNVGLTLLGLAVLTTTIGCRETRTAEEDRAERPAAAGTRGTAETDWTAERDEYIARREGELDELDRRWENFRDQAGARSRAAWERAQKESSELRRELRELRTASGDAWEQGKQRIDARWQTFEANVQEVFGSHERHP
jgi:hypothetical protein